MYRRNRNKYNNKKFKQDGYVFDSKLEFVRYNNLKLMERNNDIKELKIHKRFLLQEKFTRNGNTFKKIEYECDFYYFDVLKNSYVCEDTKGFETDVFSIKKKMFLKRYPDILFLQNKQKEQKYF